MKQYVYRYLDGTTTGIDLPDHWADLLSKLDHKEELNNRKETRRHQSLDKLLEYDDYLIVSKEPGPLELLLLKEQNEQSLPMLDVLTTEQRETMRAYYLDGYSKVEIARKFKIDESAVRRRLKRANQKILAFLSLD